MERICLSLAHYGGDCLWQGSECFTNFCLILKVASPGTVLLPLMLSKMERCFRVCRRYLTFCISETHALRNIAWNRSKYFVGLVRDSFIRKKWQNLMNVKWSRYFWHLVKKQSFPSSSFPVSFTQMASLPSLLSLKNTVFVLTFPKIQAGRFWGLSFHPSSDSVIPDTIVIDSLFFYVFPGLDPR